jgi:hypothetical protein
MAASGGREQRPGKEQRSEAHADLDDGRMDRREVAPGDTRALI